jgi:CRISPR-associated protein Cas1
LKKLLNTLYVASKNSYLHKEGENIVVKHETGEKIHFPIHNLESIICFGPISCSTPLMELCGERKVCITFLSEYGRYYARVEGPVSGNVLLRRSQYRKADDVNAALDAARSIVLAKLQNSRNVLLRSVRDSNEAAADKSDALQSAVRHLHALLNKVRNCDNIDSLSGIEGDGARAYFAVFNHLIVAQKRDLFFNERSRRPPLDNVNALLSFVYTILTHDISAALQGVGLDPAVGFLHAVRPGRPSLALDILEEVRAYLGDRLVLSLVNRNQVKGKGFRQTESGAVVMDDDTRKTLLTAYQKRKYEEIVHPFLKERINIGLIPFVQAQLMARYLRGDLDDYPPFFLK